MSTRGAYQFAAEPRAVQSRSKYRNQNINRPSDYDGIQNDARVQSNYFSKVGENTETKRSSNMAGVLMPKEENIPENLYAPVTDRIAQDEKNIVPYFYVDRPPTPEFKPLPPGVDVATQIEDTELFDFRLEVEPVLQVLVGKTLEQAQIELREEDSKLEEMRHRMRFEKKRNAELMVTQRKEALHIRKEEEKERRQKQYTIEKQDKAIAHQKYITRLLAKHVVFGMKDFSIRTLADQGVLSSRLKIELRKEHLPYLIQNTLVFLENYFSLEDDLKKMVRSLQKEYSSKHAGAVKVEVDRREKILADKKAEIERLAAEKKRRRERRRKLRLYVAKTAFLEKIQATILAKPVEVENPFLAEITDIFPTGKESAATIGGLLGELWLVLDTFQAEMGIEIKNEDLMSVLNKILNEKFKTKELNLYLSQEYQQIVQDTLQQMTEDLIYFNQNKAKIVQDLADQMEETNCFQNIRTLYSNELLDHSILKKLNLALLSIFFTSIDYKPPAKRSRKPTEIFNENLLAEPNQLSDKVSDIEERKSNAGDQQGEALLGSGRRHETELSEDQKIPEITPLEQASVHAKKKLKLNFVENWEFNAHCDAVVRFRIPLNRDVRRSRAHIDKEKEKENDEDKGDDNDERKSETKESRTKEKPKNDKILPKLEESIKEDKNEKLKRMVENDDFIEPFDGTTFEKEKKDYIEADMSDYNLKMYNTSFAEGKSVVQINERFQNEIRKELVTIIKESVPDWKELDDQVMLANVHRKYQRNEKAIIDSLISNPEEIPIFDIESF